MQRRVPIVVVTGFLGSGKTTLLNRLLARRAQRSATGKIGVVVNELGEVGVDGTLLGTAASRQIELPGGCVCCVLGDELDRTLLELVDANPELEAIVLETTGVAEPLPIAWAIQRPPVAERVRLAAVVTLVDAESFSRSRALSVAVDAQVSYADVVLVTKADLVHSDDLPALEAEIRTLASRSVVWIRTTDEHVTWLEATLADPDLESHPKGQDPGDVHPPTKTDNEAPMLSACDDIGCRHVEHHHGRSAHGIDSVWVPVRYTVDLEELEDRLAQLPGNYVRIKGILHAVDSRSGVETTGWVAVHRVGLRVSQEPIDVPDTEEGRLVALGPHVQARELAQCLEDARVPG